MNGTLEDYLLEGSCVNNLKFQASYEHFKTFLKHDFREVDCVLAYFGGQ